jgi:hypothetical protein
MKNFIILILGSFIVVNNTLGQNISPFSPETETLTFKIKSIFESLPLATPSNKIEGTVEIIETIVQNELSKPLGIYKFKEGQIVGKINTEVRGPIKLSFGETYIWIAKGNIRLYQIITNKKTDTQFFYATHYEKTLLNNLTWTTDCIIANNEIFTQNNTIQNIVSKTTEPLRLKKIEDQYHEALNKKEWNFNNRTINGKITGYKNGKVHIQQDDKRPFQMDVTKFSLDNQHIIKSYIDYLGIPTREVPPKKGTH